MDAAAKLLEGYGLTEKEKTDLPELMAGYCRLIDEAELCFYGDTEEEVIAACKANSLLSSTSVKYDAN